MTANIAIPHDELAARAIQGFVQSRTGTATGNKC
jgi:hypothetical protein